MKNLTPHELDIMYKVLYDLKNGGINLDRGVYDKEAFTRALSVLLEMYEERKNDKS